MNTAKANLINSISLIIMGLWGFFDVSSPTALIPVFFGTILFCCFITSYKKPDSNKIVSHIAVFLTLIILLALVVMRLPQSIETSGIGLLRVIVMIVTSALATVFFIKSSIDARKK